jgi:hypothetical protein
MQIDNINNSENINTLNLPTKQNNEIAIIKEEKQQIPNIFLLSVKEIKDINNEQSSNEFEMLIKQIIDKQDEKFLNGDTNIIEYLLCKYLKIPKDEFNRIDKLTLKVNEEFNLFEELGEHTPNLLELNLNNSRIESIFELGTKFVNLITLNMSNCFLKDLSGKNHILFNII